VLASFHQSDSLSAAVAKIIKLSMALHLVYFPFTNGTRPTGAGIKPDIPCYVDVSLT
jgi:hypothetical protein